ncbi:MAG TPA: Maf family protein [Syntrophomonadaceae bacterium]|nr:Maf family protein [Syntrophomonadaceae bacterium]
MKKIILASGSPRRRELFDRLGIDYTQITAEIAEDIQLNELPEEAVRRIAQEKAKAVSQALKSGIIVSADTIVVYNGMILGKPKNELEAFDFLETLSGNSHRVITAICLINKHTGFCAVKTATTLVHFRDLSGEEIKAYIATKEPFGKAGAYAIQGIGALLVEKIEGCYFNVVGLPLTILYEMLLEQGVNLLGG